MKARLGYLSLLITACAQAHPGYDDRPIENASDLNEWCKTESEAYFIGQATPPYNWSSSYWSEGNALFVKGNWLVGHDHITVQCHVAQGARREYAAFEIVEKK